jgi:hypothetical protein
MNTMIDFVRLTARFSFTALCALTGIGCEIAGQSLRLGSNHFLRAADRCWETALGVNGALTPKGESCNE